MADHALAEGTVLSGTYRIVRRIGRGGMGEVFEAVHKRTGATFAVKVLAASPELDDTAMERFRREAEVTSRLRHPNIVKVFDFDRLPDGTPFLAMELLSGTDLAAVAAAGGVPMPLARVATIVDQISLALFAAHEAGVVHRDLKPANIFVEPLPGSARELVRVLDFGISKLRNAPASLTQTATIIGTPHYMSPEQAMGRTKNIDGRSDQFSLAAIAYELLTGRRAFGAEAEADDSALAVMFRVVHQQPPSWASLNLSLPDALEAVVARGLAKEPQDRYPDIRAFAEAFLRVSALTGQPAEDRPRAAGETTTTAAPATAVPATPSTMLLPTSGPPVTTLQLASGQTRLLPTEKPSTGTAAGRRLRRLPMIAVGAAAAVLVLIAAMAARHRAPHSEESTSPREPVTEAPAPGPPVAARAIPAAAPAAEAGPSGAPAHAPPASAPSAPAGPAGAPVHATAAATPAVAAGSIEAPAGGIPAAATAAVAPAPGTPRASTRPERPARLRLVPITLEHVPDELTVWEGDRALRLPLWLPQDGRVHHLTFRAPGAADLRADVVGRAGETVSLARMAAPPRRPPRPTEPPPRAATTPLAAPPRRPPRPIDPPPRAPTAPTPPRNEDI